MTLFKMKFSLELTACPVAPKWGQKEVCSESEGPVTKMLDSGTLFLTCSGNPVCSFQINTHVMVLSRKYSSLRVTLLRQTNPAAPGQPWTATDSSCKRVTLFLVDCFFFILSRASSRTRAHLVLKGFPWSVLLFLHSTIAYYLTSLREWMRLCVRLKQDISENAKLILNSIWVIL